MKTLLSKFSFFSILALTSFLFLSFTQGVVWLDENHNQVTQENGVFYRPIPEKKRSIYLIVDYYRNGAKYREGKAASFAVKKEGFKEPAQDIKKFCNFIDITKKEFQKNCDKFRNKNIWVKKRNKWYLKHPLR